jgi:hypothetical protein
MMDNRKFVIYHKETTVFLNSNKVYFSSLRSARAALTRAVNTGKIKDKSKYEIAEANYFKERIEKVVERVNISSGKIFFEPVNTPACCSPSSELFYN